MSFNLRHVRGAVNVNCADRWNRKRLVMGRATLADLATPKDAKEMLRDAHVKQVVVYDDAAADCQRLPAAGTLHAVLSALVDDGKEPVLLAGNLIPSRLTLFLID